MNKNPTRESTKWSSLGPKGFLRGWSRRFAGGGSQAARLSARRGAIVGAVLAALFFGVWILGALQFIEWMTIDARFVARFLLSQPAHRAPVTVVAIDEQAIRAFGRWPWPRAVQAQVIEELLAANPAVLGIDVLYTSPDSDSNGDRRLARSLRSDVPVVLAAAKGTDGELTPLLSLMDQNLHLGHINSPPDFDGVIRRLPFEIETSLGSVKTLGWEVAKQLFERAGRPLIQPPLDPRGRFLVNFRPKSDSPVLSVDEVADTISVVDVVQHRALDKVKGRPVLLGVTAPGLDSLDEHLTSLRPLGQIPGVYVHAAALSSIVDGAYLRRQAPVGVLIMVVAFGLTAGVGAFLFRPWPATIGFVLSLLGFGLYVVWRFLAHGVVIETVPVVGVMVTSYVAGLWHAHLQVEKEAKFIRDTFRRYVAPEVVDSLLVRPDEAQLEGGRRQVTVMFADIRGFTSYAEETPPERVVARLNRYLEFMADSVLLYGGMLDKYLGDGLMALFGAPLPAENHAEAAVSAGLHLLRQVKGGAPPNSKSLGVGVGIHSGEAVVGSIGSATRAEYTAIGDTVNVAARLQELARPGVLLISEATLKLLPSEMASLAKPFDAPSIRGRREPVRIYELRPEWTEIVGHEDLLVGDEGHRQASD